MEPLEDRRGVDLADLRERLRLSPSERVERMVHEVAVWSEICRSVVDSQA